MRPYANQVFNKFMRESILRITRYQKWNIQILSVIYKNVTKSYFILRLIKKEPKKIL